MSKLKLLKLFVLFTLIGLTISKAHSAEAKPEETNAPEALAKLSKITGLTGNSLDVYNMTKELLERIRKEHRDNQEVIFDTVKQLESSLYILEKNSKYDTFRVEVQATFSDLKKMATEKELNSNDNLKRVVEKRIPRLLVNMVSILDDNKNSTFSQHRNKNFIEDLTLITDVYAKTKRFSAGLGISYSYMPRFKYDNLGIVDLSPYVNINDIPNTNLHQTSIGYSPSIEQKSFLSATISAEIKYVSVQLTIPMYDETFSSSSTIRSKQLSDNKYAVYRNDVSSTVKVEYDIAIKSSIRDIVQRWRPWHFRQLDYGLGYGVTGIKIEDNITTDLRFTSSPSISFDELAEAEKITTKHSNDFLTQYWLLYAKLEVSDDFEVGLDIKKYESKSIGSSSLDVEDTAISLNFLYYY